MAHRQVVVEDEAGHKAVDVQRHTQQTAGLHGRWRAKRRPQEAPERHTPPQPAAAPEAHSRRGSCTLEEEPPGRESETGSVPRPGPGDDGGVGVGGQWGAGEELPARRAGHSNRQTGRDSYRALRGPCCPVPIAERPLPPGACRRNIFDAGNRPDHGCQCAWRAAPFVGPGRPCTFMSPWIHCVCVCVPRSPSWSAMARCRVWRPGCSLRAALPTSYRQAFLRLDTWALSTQMRFDPAATTTLR